MDIKYLSDENFGRYVMYKFGLIEKEFERILGKFEQKTGRYFYQLHSYNLHEQHGIFCDVLQYIPGYSDELKEEDWGWWYDKLERCNHLLDEFLTDNFWGRTINRNIKPLLMSYSKTLE